MVPLKPKQVLHWAATRWRCQDKLRRGGNELSEVNPRSGGDLQIGMGERSVTRPALKCTLDPRVRVGSNTDSVYILFLATRRGLHVDEGGILYHDL